MEDSRIEFDPGQVPSRGEPRGFRLHRLLDSNPSIEEELLSNDSYNVIFEMQL